MSESKGDPGATSVTFTLLVARLPEVSCPTTLNECAPNEKLVTVKLYGMLLTAGCMLVPSRYNWAKATATLSVTVAEI